MKFLLLATLLIFAAPSVALAQFGRIDYIFIDILAFINGILVPFVFAIAFLVFIWGVFLYFIKGGAEPDAQNKGKQAIVYGIVGFVIMVSVWGIVNLLASGLGLTGTRYIERIPETPTYRSGSGASTGTQFQGGNVPLPNTKPTPPPRPSTGGSSTGGNSSGVMDI